MTITLASLGWDERLRTAYRRHDRPDCRPARVTGVDAGVCCLLAADGARRASIGGQLLAAAAHDRAGLPQVGDWVVLRSWCDARVTVEAVLPRAAAVPAATSAEGEPAGPPLVANVDVVVALLAAQPEPDARHIDQLLALGRASGAETLLALTTVDKLPRSRVTDLIARFHELSGGAEVLALSAARGDGLERLRELAAPGRTVALLGPAGAGQSALVAALAGATVLPQRPGKKAATALVALPGGGAVVETAAIALSAPERRPASRRSGARRGQARGRAPAMWRPDSPEGRLGRRWASSS